MTIPTKKLPNYMKVLFIEVNTNYEHTHRTSD